MVGDWITGFLQLTSNLNTLPADKSIIFDIARPRASLRGYPRILRSSKKLEYQTFDRKDNYVIPAIDIYNGTTLYYGVGNPSLIQDVNFAD